MKKISLDGNQKHKTKHNEYICYECGAIMDRDENAVANLFSFIKLENIMGWATSLSYLS